MNQDVLTPDVVVIGAGPGGYPAAIRLAQLDKEVLVVERGEIGGVCLNWGCIPTKALYSTTEPLGKWRSWNERGVEFEEPAIDLQKIRDTQKEIVESLTGGVEKLLEGNGAEIIKGDATLRKGKSVAVKKADGTEITLEPKGVVLATGSRPFELPGFEFDRELVWNSRQALQLEVIPEKLLILGAGVIGLEMATVFSRLGSEVTIVELLDGILPGLSVHRRIRSLMKRSLKKAGVTIHTGLKATDLRRKDGKGQVIAEGEEGEEQTFEVDKVLTAVGRAPVTDVLEANLELTDDGYVEVDGKLETSLEGVYAVGDLAGPPLLAHKATKEGLMAAEAFAGNGVTDYGAMPQAIFTDPEYASVGLTEEQAREGGREIKIGQFPLRASGKALAMGEPEGLVRLVVEEEGDQVLGGEILSPHASDLIAEVALAVQNGLTAAQLADTVHTHPTLSEAVMEAAENVHGQAIGIINR